MEHAMRIWLNPDRLKGYNISPQEVVTLIRQQNIEAAPGRLGAQSSETFEYVLKFKGKNNLPEQFENMIIRTDDYGGIIRLKDVARIEFGLRSYTLSGVMNGYPVTSFSVVQSKGSNGNEIMKEMDKILDDFTQNLPPGIELSLMTDSKAFLDSSINQLVRTLVEAFVLVFLIVFLFLQDIRSTLIPAIAVPVAIIGTFFFMQVFGFSINLLTMFALILAIGTVVDDAIVVVEAVREKMDNTGFKA
jgi:multidrug efflux pump subunit AcrB